VSYTTVYSGNTVNPANQPQNTIQITNSDDIQFNWPSNSSNAENSLVSLMVFNVDALVTPGNLILPDSTLASSGFRSIFINQSNDDLDIKYFDNTAFFTLPAASTYALFLIDVSTSNGTWLPYVWAEGSSSITSITQVAPAAGITITPETISGGDGTFTFALSDTLASLESIGAVASFGIPCLTAESTLTVRTIVPGSANITVTNGDGVAGNIALDVNLNPTFTTATMGNVTINGNQIISDVTGENIPTFTDSQSLSAGACAFTSDTGDVFRLRGPYGLSGDLDYELPSIAPNQDNSVLAADGDGVMNPQNYLTTGISGAWAKFDGVAGTLTSSVNIQSFVRNGPGSFTVTFTNPFANVNYMAVGNCQANDGVAYGVITYVIVDALSANIFTTALTGAPRTPTNFANTSIAFFGLLS